MAATAFNDSQLIRKHQRLFVKLKRVISDPLNLFFISNYNLK
jgi:hypothetical protein